MLMEGCWWRGGGSRAWTSCAQECAASDVKSSTVALPRRCGLRRCWWRMIWWVSCPRRTCQGKWFAVRVVPTCVAQFPRGSLPFHAWAVSAWVCSCNCPCLQRGSAGSGGHVSIASWPGRWYSKATQAWFCKRVLATERGVNRIWFRACAGNGWTVPFWVCWHFHCKAAWLLHDWLLLLLLLGLFCYFRVLDTW